MSESTSFRHRDEVEARAGKVGRAKALSCRFFVKKSREKSRLIEARMRYGLFERPNVTCVRFMNLAWGKYA